MVVPAKGYILKDPGSILLYNTDNVRRKNNYPINKWVFENWQFHNEIGEQ